MILCIQSWYYVSSHDTIHPGMILCIQPWYYVSSHDAMYPAMMLCIQVWYYVSRYDAMYQGMILCIQVWYYLSLCKTASHTVRYVCISCQCWNLFVRNGPQVCSQAKRPCKKNNFEITVCEKGWFGKYVAFASLSFVLKVGMPWAHIDQVGGFFITNSQVKILHRL
jgi:hypothetical protein